MSPSVVILFAPRTITSRGRPLAELEESSLSRATNTPVATNAPTSATDEPGDECVTHATRLMRPPARLLHGAAGARSLRAAALAGTSNATGTQAGCSGVGRGFVVVGLGHGFSAGSRGAMHG